MSQIEAKSRKEKVYNEATFSGGLSICKLYSVKKLSALFDDLLPSTRAVFLVLINHSQYYTRITFGKKKIATLTGLSLRSVDRAINDLVERGYISYQNRQYADGARRETNRYWLHEWFLSKEVLPRLKDLSYRLKIYLLPLFTLSAIMPSRADDALYFNDNNYMALTVAAHKRPTTKKEIYDLTGSFDAVHSTFFYKKKRRSEPQQCHTVEKRKEVNLQGVSMNAESLKLIEANKNKLPLTLRGQLRLSCYPKSAIEHILRQKLKLNVDNLMTWILKIARNYCNDMGIPDADFSSFEAKQYELGVANTPYIDFDALELLKSQQPGTTKPSNKEQPNMYAQNNNWPTLDDHKQQLRNWLIQRGLYADGMTFSDMIHAKRQHYIHSNGYMYNPPEKKYAKAEFTLPSVEVKQEYGADNLPF